LGQNAPLPQEASNFFSYLPTSLLPFEKSGIFLCSLFSFLFIRLISTISTG
jgi:hypothetical protein